MIMYDPFPIAPIPWLATATQPLADYLHLTTLPLHIHEVLLSFFFYNFVQFSVAPTVSRWLFPTSYAALTSSRRLNWDVHVVSLVQSTIINVLALWIIFVDEERSNMNWEERVWGYTGGAGMIQGLATGYFIWDLMVSIVHVKAFGPGMLAHAVSALTVFSFGFRPFVNFYGCTFILYELSSPFLNFHWFFDKLGMTGSKAQLYNGIVLLFTFFSCRLVWGTYQSIRVYLDVWRALHHQTVGAKSRLEPQNGTVVVTDTAVGNTATPMHHDIMRFAGDEFVPLWLAFTYLGSNLVLNFLNFYWFRQMIDTIRSRFKPVIQKEKIQARVAKKTSVNGNSRIEINDTDVRRRKIALAMDEGIQTIS